MVRNYKRKTDKASYPKEKLEDAVRAVRNGVMSGYKAAQVYNIPRMTIMDHVQCKTGKSLSLGRDTVLSQEIEKKLASYIHVMERTGFGLTRDEILEMVGDYINVIKISAPFKNGKPGKDWFKSFKDRNHLSVKKPQGVECARKKAVDPFIIDTYFKLLKNTIDQLELHNKPECIWNLDETSFSKDPSNTKVVGLRGYAATRTISTSGKDNTTVLLAANAIGDKMPPLIIFKGKNVWDKWVSPAAYPNTTYAATSNGWMEAEVFQNYFKKSFVPALGKQRPVLLIYDGHSTHVGLPIIEEALKENITILKLPAHTSHVLQPLDLAVMKPFKDRWDNILVKWQRSNTGVPLPKNEFGRLIGDVWAQIEPIIIRNGFRKAGIHPYNGEVIHEDQYDRLKLMRWKQIATSNLLEYQQHNLFVQKSKPQSLVVIALDFINKYMSPAAVEGMRIQTTNHENNNGRDPGCNNNLELEIDLRHQSVTFEELLLNKVKRGDIAKTTRQKISGAEVITHRDVVLRKRQDKTKKDQQVNSSRKSNTGDDSQINTFDRTESTNVSNCLQNNIEQTKTSPCKVKYLGSVNKNDSEFKPFALYKPKDMPVCLRNVIPDERKIHVISDILVKNPKEFFSAKRLEQPGPSVLASKKGKGIGKKSSGKENLRKVNIVPCNKNTPSKLQPKKRPISPNSSTTTSVSGSISIYSDNEELDITFDDFDKERTSTPLTNKVMPSLILTEENEICHLECEPPSISNNDVNEQTQTYSINDNVLVRYFNKNKWTYYVGIIEDTLINNEEFYYSIRFYKTIKKPTLSFKLTRKIDRDEVPEILIIKHIELLAVPAKSNEFVLAEDSNAVYF